MRKRDYLDAGKSVPKGYRAKDFAGFMHGLKPVPFVRDFSL